MKLELKPCPFCGGDAKVMFNINSKNDVWFTFIKCEVCNAQGKTFAVGEHTELDDEEVVEKKVGRAAKKAAEAWNRRKG
jgi:Lar family restriction alleviation protein